MFRYLLIVPAAVLLAVGAEGLYHLARSRHQVGLTCAEFVRSRPSSLNVRVDGCEIDTAAATYRVSGDRLQELLFPARLPGTPTTRPVPIIVATSERGALDLAQPAVAAVSELPREEFTAAMQRALAAAGGPVISGRIRAGLLDRLFSSRGLARLGTPLAADAVVIDQHRGFGLLGPAGAFAAGLALLAPVFLRRRSWSPVEDDRDLAAERLAVRERLLTYTATTAPQAEPQPRESHGAAPLGLPETQPAPAARAEETAVPAMPAIQRAAAEGFRFPAVMLLNLDLAATAEAIEAAPPLGPRDLVIARLRAAIPSLAIRASGLLVTPAIDPHLICDPGRHDIVHTIVVQVNEPRGVDLLSELVVSTGWRAFVPRLGRFVGPHDLDRLYDPVEQGALIS